jgi:ribosomal protein L16 Arg81 hydroxylase
MKKILPIISLILFIGCGQNKKSAEPDSQNISKDTTAFTSPVKVTTNTVVLLPEAKEITGNWLAYLTAQAEMENFKDYNVKDIISNASPIAEIMNTLRQSVPEELKMKAVETRLSVLYTKAKVLEFLSKKRNPDPREIAATAEELPVEFKNFKIQINEIYLKTLEDFEEELDDYEFEQDTTTTTLKRTPGPGRNNK